MTSGEVTTDHWVRVANSVGMALYKMLPADIADSAAFKLMSQRVFAICSDGDLMEGISYEAASMAAHWGLDNLVWLYDDNKITIDGSIDIAFSENVEGRFESFGWRVLRADGHDADSIRTALSTAVAEDTRPTIIICRTHIGYGSPNKVDTAKSHGSPLGADEMALTRAGFDWPETPFHVSDDVRAYFAESIQRKTAQHEEWSISMTAWREANPAEAKVYDTLWSGDLPEGLAERLVSAAPPANATRKTCQCLTRLQRSRVWSVGLRISPGPTGRYRGRIVGNPDFEGQDSAMMAVRSITGSVNTRWVR